MSEPNSASLEELNAIIIALNARIIELERTNTQKDQKIAEQQQVVEYLMDEKVFTNLLENLKEEINQKLRSNEFSIETIRRELLIGMSKLMALIGFDSKIYYIYKSVDKNDEPEKDWYLTSPVVPYLKYEIEEDGNHVITENNENPFAEFDSSFSPKVSYVEGIGKVINYVYLELEKPFTIHLVNRKTESVKLVTEKSGGTNKQYLLASINGLQMIWLLKFSPTKKDIGSHSLSSTNIEKLKTLIQELNIIYNLISQKNVLMDKNSQLKHLEMESEAISLIDFLTLLPNRRSLNLELLNFSQRFLRDMWEWKEYGKFKENI